MEKVARIVSVRTAQTRAGNTRYVVRDEDGDEFTTFRPGIGAEAQRQEGSTVLLRYHEEQRGNFRNVYLDAVEPPPAAGEDQTQEHGDTEPDEVAWRTAVEAAPWLLGTTEPKRKVPPEDLYERLEPFKQLVADDIRSGEEPQDDQ